MIILYDSNGKLETGDLFTQGKYKSDKIIGRCLLWITPKYKIMDRIYTINDSDVDLFKEFGKQQGFWWKSCQDSDNYFQLENGSKSESDVLVYINLKLSEFHRYPYLDTFFFLNTDENVLTNDSDYPSNRELRSTSGGYDS
jgi:hypothetical protein